MRAIDLNPSKTVVLATGVIGPEIRKEMYSRWDSPYPEGAGEQLVGFPNCNYKSMWTSRVGYDTNK